MARIVILLAVLAAGLLIWYKIRRSNGEQRKKIIMWTIIWAIVGTLMLLAATGKLNIITAAIGSFIAFIPRLLGYLKYLPLLSRFYQQRKTGNQSSHTNTSTPPRSGTMNRQEALDILGLKPGASREEILKAHKRMIQKVHPDRGGSDVLAAQINKAKDVLIG